MKLFSPLSPVYITQWFGGNPQMYAKFGMKGHNGIDYRTRFSDTPKGRRYIYAVADGEVIRLKQSNVGYGNEVRIDHEFNGKKFTAIYGHNTSFKVKVGQKVKGGDVVAISGSTGNSTGPHLHFEIRPDSESSRNGYYGAVNPMQFENFGKELIDPATGDVLIWEGNEMIKKTEINEQSRKTINAVIAVNSASWESLPEKGRRAVEECNTVLRSL